MFDRLGATLDGSGDAATTSTSVRVWIRKVIPHEKFFLKRAVTFYCICEK